MKTSIGISLLYFLLIIPHHGNSPVPIMESWLQTDQDDGVVQRDMTSSLTGKDESFGSAHQSYQNSLVRKKKSDNSKQAMSLLGYRQYDGELEENPNYQQSDIYSGGRYIDSKYNMDVSNDAIDEADLEKSDTISGYPAYKYRSYLLDPNAVDEGYGVRPNDRYVDPQDMMGYNNEMNGVQLPRERNLSPLRGTMKRDAQWPLRSRIQYPPHPYFNEERPLMSDGPFFQNSYSNIFNDRGQEIEIQDAPQSYGKSEDKDSENYYYDVRSSSGASDDEDYNQAQEDRTFTNKRDEGQDVYARGGLGSSQGPLEKKVIILMDENNNKIQLKFSPKKTGLMRPQKKNMENDITVSEIDGQNNGADSPLSRQELSGLQSKALVDILRDSERALQEVQLFQQKSMKPADGKEKKNVKRDNLNQALNKYERESCRHFDDDVREKREDEDEQKNMKTGTDEGGGGEYEDEEGKGHKDEEEYYEDADLSDKGSGHDMRSKGALTLKYNSKRETVGDTHLKNSKEEQNTNNAEDYELNLENAPVENAEKNKKSSLRKDGEKSNKSSVRKGVKIWDEWGKWSPCSVTCGVGRTTRWRHCIGGGCAQGEKEAQIKRCTNPAC